MPRQKSEMSLKRASDNAGDFAKRRYSSPLGVGARQLVR